MDVLKTNPLFQGIQYIHGDFSDESTLLRINVKEAERILILADRSESFSDLEIDSRTVLAVLTIENLNPSLYCAAELLDSKFEKHLSLAHCDEIILTNVYERNLIVSASNGTGVSHVLRELINGPGGKGLEIVDIPSEFVGKTYYDLALSFKGDPLLIGLLENTGNFVNRKKKALSEAQKNPDMRKIVANLQKVKSLESNKPVIAPGKNNIILNHTKAVVIYSNTERGA